mgnify:CR=1 FL=1
MRKNIYKFKKEDFNIEAANFISDRIKSFENKPVHIALSGGNTPLPILELLKEKEIKWDLISFFMVDERCVPLDSDRSNFNNIYKIFFSHITSKSYSMVHEKGDYKMNAIQYEELIKTKVPISSNGVPKFDLVLLGMGDDGHTASLFPETEALLEKSKSVVYNEVPQLNSERITLTYPVLFNAEEILVLAKGKKKLQIIDEIHNGKETGFPIEKITNIVENLKWLVAL